MVRLVKKLDIVGKRSKFFLKHVKLVMTVRPSSEEVGRWKVLGREKSRVQSGHNRLPRCLSGKEYSYQAGDLGLIPGLGQSPGEGNGNRLQCSCLRSPMEEEPGRLQCMGSQRDGHNLASKPPPP